VGLGFLFRRRPIATGLVEPSSVLVGRVGSGALQSADSAW
jgi:hypothetical protein